ncbi:IctB family putative bicarbonate transporter [Thermostichus vulcanus]|uniref:IctB family putative bicarbonate transporter n=1 Tax=Thermostichus vulcanus str. 'Rupite' TaxID=2813851 RepID=A0ABT0C858_THEVL|nr:IctB family putative bicarbonate transporter [Thermostichus vulcanus]MCJ2541974.1 IctB family putative bicarbonate transporter [Thermostichus vulcanus str. 'Rupite']
MERAMELWRGFLLRDFDVQAWWQGSVLGRLSGSLQHWGKNSLWVQTSDGIALGLVMLYWGFSAQPSTGILGLILLVMAAMLGLGWLVQTPSWVAAHLPLGLFWGIATLATIFSPVPYAARDGWLKLTLYLAGYLLLHRLLQKPRCRDWVVGSLLLVSLVMGVYGLRQYFYGAAELATWVDPESGLAGVTRVYSYLRNPNLYGGYLIPLIPLGLGAAWIWPSWGAKLLATFITLVNLICLLLTYSRGAWIGALVMVATMAVLLVQWNSIHLPGRWRRWTLPALFAGGGAALLLGILTVRPLRLRVQSLFLGRVDTSNNFRINVWAAVLDMIRDFPILGIGPGNVAFNRVYPLYQRGNFSALGSYSVPLELTLETGFIGSLTFAWFLLVLFDHGWRQWRLALGSRDPQGLWVAAGLAACVGMMAHGLVDTIWYRPQVQMLWWLAVALITASLGSLQTIPSQQEQRSNE